MNNNIIKFLRNELETPEGDTILNIIDWSDEELESNHKYIQYLFPLYEASKFNPNAPLLDDETVEAINKNFRAQLGLYDAFVRMLQLYQLQTSEADQGYTGLLYVGWIPYLEADEPITSFLAENDHNHLRITRILTCLRLCGLQEYAEAFYRFLKAEYELGGRFSETAFNFWKNAVYPETFAKPEDYSNTNTDLSPLMDKMDLNHPAIGPTSWEDQIDGRFTDFDNLSNNLPKY